MPEYIPPVPCSIVEKLFLFENQKEAQDWLQQKNLNIAGTPLLVPFKKDGGIEFLKLVDKGDSLRIIGAANYLKPKKKTKKLLNRIKKTIKKKSNLPHMNQLVGDTIQLANQGLIIIYEKGNKSAGDAFAAFFSKEKDEIKKQIVLAKTNDAVSLNIPKVLEGLTILALDLEIKVGMSYFIREDEKHNLAVFRHTFKSGLVNPNIARYLDEEKKLFPSQVMQIKNHKIKDYHRIDFIRSLVEYIIISAFVSLLTGLVSSFFIPELLAGIVAVGVLLTLSYWSYMKAYEQNQTTIRFSGAIFESKAVKHFSFIEIEQGLSRFLSYLREKLLGTKQSLSETHSTLNNSELDSNVIPSAPPAYFDIFPVPPSSLTTNPIKSTVEKRIKSWCTLFKSKKIESAVNSQTCCQADFDGPVIKLSV